MTPYRRNRTLRKMEKQFTRKPAHKSLRVLKILIDAAIARGEKMISEDIARYIIENKES